MKEYITAWLEAIIQNNQGKMEARIDANNEKFWVLRSSIVSRMDIYQARTEDNQEEIITKTDAHQESMGASVNILMERDDGLPKRYRGLSEEEGANVSGDRVRSGE
jgi:uncharacterized protein YPO0396